MNGKIPLWLEDAVFYEIYPQSFKDSNGDGIGDLRGIISKLDYIQGLGFNALWINPCFVSPFEDAGYDVADYYRIAPRYGSNADAKRLFAEARKRGIRVLLDLVPGHSSWKHPWFVESSKHRRNKYSDWYLWTNAVWEPAGPGLETVRGLNERDGGFITNFFASQPALNFGFAKRDPKKPWQLSPLHPTPRRVTAEITKIIRYWLDLGADGFRVDMAGAMVKNDPDQAATVAFWKRIFAGLSPRYPRAAFIAEWGNPSRALKAGFDMDFLLHFGSRGYSSLFREGKRSYFMPAGKGSAEGFWKEYAGFARDAKGKGLVCIPSGNHDMERLARGRKPEDLGPCFAFLLTMPGAPFIYYGDEIGMGYVEGLPSKEGGYGRTGSRTPMQWSSAKNRGFSSGAASKLYLPTDPRRASPDVASQEGRERSTLETVRALIRIRHQHPALRSSAGLRLLKAGSAKEPMIYLRETKGQRVLVVVNPKAKAMRTGLRVACKGLRPLLVRGVELRRNGRLLELKAAGRGFGLFELS